MDIIIAGDIGGTKTNIGVYSRHAGPRSPIHEASFTSSAYASIEDILTEFLSGIDISVDHAVFGVAGPVIESRVKITNLDWEIDIRKLQEALNIESVHLLNDLEAVAYGINILDDSDILTLNKGKPSINGPIAVIAPGTGLGEAFLTWNGSRYIAYASEGGHTDFAPSNVDEIGLLRHLLKTFDHVSYERICSGMGIPNIYGYLKDSGYHDEPEWLAARLSDKDDITPIIISTALEKNNTCELCSRTLDMFLSILGAEAGNAALKIMATGGVYLGGGILPRIVSAIYGPLIMKSFTGKGRMSHILEAVPLHIIMNPKTAVMGAASYGLEMI